MNKYDLIGDIHGHAEGLVRLLEQMEYRKEGNGYRHSTRTVIFLGDFIDRGSRILETLEIARTMVDEGEAFAVMGNHEYNAICYHTSDGAGGHLREHNPKNDHQHAATVEAFKGKDDLWREYLEWFKTLPLFLDFGNLRVAHACWHDGALDALGRNPRFDDSLLVGSGKTWTPRMEAVNLLLKGPEMLLPKGSQIADHDGHIRKDFRVKWWGDLRARSYAEVALPMPLELPDEPFPENERSKLCGYPDDAPPMFFGHYGFKKDPAPMKPNLACVDFAVTGGGCLGAYRWDGEQKLNANKFVTSHEVKPRAR